MLSKKINAQVPTVNLGNIRIKRLFRLKQIRSIKGTPAVSTKTGSITLLASVDDAMMSNWKPKSNLHVDTLIEIITREDFVTVAMINKEKLRNETSRIELPAIKFITWDDCNRFCHHSEALFEVISNEIELPVLTNFALLLSLFLLKAIDYSLLKKVGLYYSQV